MADFMAELKAEFPGLTMSVAFDMLAYKKQQEKKSALELAPDVDEQTMMMINAANQQFYSGNGGAAAPPPGGGATAPPPGGGATAPPPGGGATAPPSPKKPPGSEPGLLEPPTEGSPPVVVTQEDVEPWNVAFGVTATSTAVKIIVDESSIPGTVDEAEVEVLWFPSGFLIDTFTKWRKTAVKDMGAPVWNITGLSPNTAYVFQVTAKGAGAAVAKKTTPTGIPAFDVDALSSTSIGVTLARGTEAPENLTIEYQSTGYVVNGPWLRESLVRLSPLTYEVQNLAANTEYRFRVVRPALKRYNMAKCYTLKEEKAEATEAALPPPPAAAAGAVDLTDSPLPPPPLDPSELAAAEDRKFRDDGAPLAVA